MSGDSIEFKHRGYTIRFSHNEEEWTSYDAGLSDKSLSKLKASIDRLSIKTRKECSFMCSKMITGNGVTRVDAEVIEYLGPVINRPYVQNRFERGPPEVQSHKVAIITDGRERRKRETVTLKDLVLDIPENDAIERELREIDAELKRLREKAHDLAKTLMHPSIADFQKLVDISDIDPTGGLIT
jgi:hypothetical protein